MNQFRKTACGILKQVEHVTADQQITPGTYFLENGEIAEYPREDGDSRYPYLDGGLVLWVNASGKLSAADGGWTVLPDQPEGMEPAVNFFQKRDGGHTIALLEKNIRLAETKKFTVFDKKAAYFFLEDAEAMTVLRVNVNHSRCISFRLGYHNRSKKTQEIILTAYLNPLLRHALRDEPYFKWWKQCLCESGNKFLFESKEDIARGNLKTYWGEWGCNDYSGPESVLQWKKQTTSRNDFIGDGPGVAAYQIDGQGSFRRQVKATAFAETAVAAEARCYKLPADAWVELEYQFMFGEKTAGAKLELPIHTQKKAVLAAEWRGWNQAGITDFKWNHFWQHVCRQCAFCAFGKNYAGPLLGIRDVFQHIEAAMYWEPGRAREKILEALGMIFIDGRPPRQYSVPEHGRLPQMDLRLFIDQGVWIISTVISYLRATDDVSLLQEDVGYYELLDEQTQTMRHSGRRDSVLEHLLRIADFLAEHIDPETGCLRAMFGDWNDALDGLGVPAQPGEAYGSGVSVMASLQFYQNLCELEELAAWSGHALLQKNLDRYVHLKQRLQKGLLRWGIVENENGNHKVLHGWGDRRQYLVGSYQDVDGCSRDALTVSAFWVLSGMFRNTPELQSDLLAAFERLDSQYGYRTFAPGFEPDVKGVGRIVQMPQGTAENGGVYVHASMFAVRALFQMGCAEQAWVQLMKLLPLTHEKVSHSPFVMPNSYCENKALGIDGQSMNDWYTGSANGLVKTMLHFGIGVYPQFGGVWIQPAQHPPYKELQLSIPLKQGNLQLFYLKQGNKRRYLVNGIEREGIWDETMKLHKCWVAAEELCGSHVTVEVLE